MRTVIYADVLVAVNCIVNYFLLRAAAAVTGSRSRPWRMIAACLLGGSYALIIFWESIPFWLNAALLLLSAAGMLLIAFGFGRVKLFLRRMAAFLLADCFFAGVMLAIQTLLQPQPLVFRNGIVYLDLDLFTLTVLSVVCYLLLSLAARLAGGKPPKQTVYRITVQLGERAVSGRALLDTGNALRDGFSARPVLIAQRSFVQPLLPQSGELACMRGFRLVPFSTVGKTGLLQAFTADRVQVRGQGAAQTYSLREAVIAVTEQPVADGGFEALFGPAFLEQADAN